MMFLSVVIGAGELTQRLREITSLLLALPGAQFGSHVRWFTTAVNSNSKWIQCLLLVLCTLHTEDKYSHNVHT